MTLGGLLATNALFMLSDSVVRVIAPSLSALLLLHIGPTGIAAIDAATFVISVVCSFLLILPPSHHREAIFPLRRKHVNDLRTIATEDTRVRQKAIATTHKRRWPLIDMGVVQNAGGLLIPGAIVAYVAGTLSILFPIYVQTTLAGGPLIFGWLMTAQALGEGLVSILLGRSTAQREKFKVAGLLPKFFVIGGLALMLIATQHTLALDLLFNIVFGAMTAAAAILLLTLLQQHTAGSVLGRTLATYMGMQSFAQVAGMGVASILVLHTGVTWLIICDGALYLSGAIVVCMLRMTAFRHRP